MITLTVASQICLSLFSSAFIQFGVTTGPSLTPTDSQVARSGVVKKLEFKLPNTWREVEKRYYAEIAIASPTADATSSQQWA